MCAHVCVCMCSYVCTQGGQRLTLGIFYSLQPILLVEHRTHQFSYVGIPLPSLCSAEPSLLRGCWDLSTCSFSKPFTHRESSLALACHLFNALYRKDTTTQEPYFTSLHGTQESCKKVERSNLKITGRLTFK